MSISQVAEQATAPTPPSTRHDTIGSVMTDIKPEDNIIRDRGTFEALAAKLGTPTRTALPGEVEHWLGTTSQRVTPSDTETWHPVFAFAHHYRANDDYADGYTANPARGDHMSIPGYTEDETWGVIEISFHKGATTVDYVSFDQRPSDQFEVPKWQALYDAARTLLEEHETR